MPDIRPPHPMHVRHMMTSAAAILLFASAVSAAPPNRGQSLAVFGSLALEATPPLGADTPMTPILSLHRLGTVEMYCYVDALSVVSGAFAVLNTTAKPIIVSGFGTLQPGEQIVEGFIGNGGVANTFQVTSQFDDPDRIATVVVSGIVEGTRCLGHARAIVQP